MLISAKKVYLHKRTKRRVVVIDIDGNSVKIRYVKSGHGSFYFIKDFVAYFEIFE
jgi:hypothetical protein